VLAGHTGGKPGDLSKQDDMTRNTQFYTYILASMLLLPACSTLNSEAAAPADGKTGKVVAKPKVTTPTPPRQDLPNVELDANLLFTLISGEIAGYRGELELATRQYLDVAKRTRDPRVIERAVRVANFAKNYPLGLEAARLWLEISPTSTKAKTNVASLLLRNGKREEAVKVIDGIITSAASLETGFIIAGKIILAEPNRELAVAVIRQLVLKHPKVASGHFVLSSLAEQTGKLVLAESSVREAIRLRQGWSDAKNQLARILHLQGHTDKAVAYLASELESTPDDSKLRLSYARLLVDAKKIKQARTEFERLAADSPENTDILFALGILALQSSDYVHAEKYLASVAGKGRRGMEASYYLGQIAEQLKQPVKAINWYNKVAHGDFAFDAKVRIARLLTSEGKYALALQRLNSIRARGDTQYVSVVLAKAGVYQKTKRYEDAMVLYNEAIEKLPENNDLLYARALMAERVDRLDILFKDLKSVLQRDPDNAHANNALGYTLADRTTRYDEALTYINKAYELMPDDAAILDSMGWVHFRLGKYEEALKHLTRAYDLNSDAEIAAHLVELLWVMGEKQRARKVLNRGLEKSPDDEHIVEVMKRLEL